MYLELTNDKNQTILSLFPTTVDKDPSITDHQTKTEVIPPDPTRLYREPALGKTNFPVIKKKDAVTPLSHCVADFNW